MYFFIYLSSCISTTTLSPMLRNSGTLSVAPAQPSNSAGLNEIVLELSPPEDVGGGVSLMVKIPFSGVLRSTGLPS